MSDKEISKSQIKRDAHVLLTLAEQLSQLSKKQLRQVMLPPDILTALDIMATVTSFNARKRHIQHIAKLLRQTEVIDQIQASFDAVINQSQLNTAEFAKLEHWRTRLMSDDKTALTEFVRQYKCVEVQALRLAVRRAKQERDKHKNPGAQKALFRLLRELVQ